MQTTTLNDSMMSDFFQVNGYSNMDGGLIPITKIPNDYKGLKPKKLVPIIKGEPITESRLREIIKEKEINRMMKERLLTDPERIYGNGENPFPPQEQKESTQSTENNNTKTNYLLIGIGAILLVGVTTLIVKKS